MHYAVIYAIYVLLYDSFIDGTPLTWDEELDRINSRLLEISTKVMAAVDAISMKIDGLSEKLDVLNNEMESQKSAVHDIKKSLENSSSTWAKEKEDLTNLMKKIESVGQKQHKDQQSVKDSLNSQTNKLTEIKDLTATGFKKALEKLASISEGEESITDVFNGVKKLATVYTEQEIKLNTIINNLQQTSDSIGRARDDNANNLGKLWQNVSVTLKEQNKPLSPEATSHVKRAVALSNIVIKEMNSLKDLQPKLVHVVRLSENLRKDLVDHNLSPVANNLTNSLKALESSTPPIIISVSKEANSLEVILLGLIAMSKENECPADLTAEIRDHHNEILKYLNSTSANNKSNERINHDAWNTVMKKLENIEKTSEANISVYDRLSKLREDIGGVRKTLQEYLGESDPDEDVVFG